MSKKKLLSSVVVPIKEEVKKVQSVIELPKRIESKTLTRKQNEIEKVFLFFKLSGFRNN